MFEQGDLRFLILSLIAEKSIYGYELIKTIEERTGEPYAVVEYVEGRSLGDVRSRAVQLGQAIAWADAVAVTKQQGPMFVTTSSALVCPKATPAVP